MLKITYPSKKNENQAWALINLRRTNCNLYSKRYKLVIYFNWIN